MYYLTSGGVIEDGHSVSYSNLISSLPATFTIPYDYNDADRKAIFITLDLTFTDDKKFYNTDYRLQFNTSASCYAYSYVFNLPDTYINGLIPSDVILASTDLAFKQAYMGIDIGDVYRYPVTMHNNIVNTFNSEFGSDFTNNITKGNGRTNSTTKFTCDFHIPQNQTMLYYLDLNSNNELQDSTPAPRTLRICLYLYQDYGTQTSLQISDFTLIPINGTEQYYQDEIFQNDVIGSDEDGNESGLKGIIAFLKNLPGAIFDYFEGFFLWLIGSDQEGNESGILGILAYIKKLPSLIMDKLKELFVPDDEFLNNTLVDMDAFMIQHLGILYQAPKELIELIRDFLSLDVPFFVDVVDYKLKMPAFTIYFNSDPPPGQDIIYSNIDNDYQASASDLSSYIAFNVLPDNSLSGEEEGFYLRLNFLGKQPFASLYNIYRVFSYAFVIVVFLLYAYRRFNAVLGGLG